MKLSILIASLVSRTELYRTLASHLKQQMQGLEDQVELLVLTDAKEVSTGVKRQKLLERAKGEHVVFIDDDDWVPDYYVRELLHACSFGMDCVAINGTMTTDGTNEISWRISCRYENKTIHENGRMVYLRKTNHITAVKRTLALQAGFPDKSNAEDKWYSDRVAPLCKTETDIKLPMYHYRYSSKNKEY